VDTGISAIVTALQRLGIQTVSSCEGHWKDNVKDAYVAVKPNSNLNQVIDKISDAIFVIKIKSIKVDVIKAKNYYSDIEQSWVECDVIKFRNFGRLGSPMIKKRIGNEIASILTRA